MDTLEYDFQVHSTPRAGDDKLAIRFFVKAKQDPDLSLKEGRPIFKEIEYITIMVPGDRNAAHTRPVRPLDLQRFAKQYEHWKQTKSNDVMLGTPIDVLGLSLAQVEEYRYFGVRTVEQMADLRDDVCQKMMGANSLKQKAVAYLALMKEEAPMKRVTAELEARDAKISTLEQAIAEQAEIIKKLQADSAKGQSARK